MTMRKTARLQRCLTHNAVRWSWLWRHATRTNGLHEIWWWILTLSQLHIPIQSKFQILGGFLMAFWKPYLTSNDFLLCGWPLSERQECIRPYLPCGTLRRLDGMKETVERKVGDSNPEPLKHKDIHIAVVQWLMWRGVNRIEYLLFEPNCAQDCVG